MAIRRAFIPAAELQPFVDQLWARAPACVSRNDPASWVDAGQRWVNTPTDRPGHGSNLEVFSADSRWWIGEIGHDLDFMRATCRHPRMLRMVESFLGGPVKLPTRNRGLYTVWPRRAPARQLGPHLDNQSEELLATTYLGPVDAADGGFTLWPRSHKSMWCASHEQINWVPNGTRDQRMAKIRAETQPLVFTGEIGDTLFWHARLVHSSGVNFGTNVRVAAIQDFRRCWPSSQLEWMVKTPDGGLTMRVKGYEEGGAAVAASAQHVRQAAVQSILPYLMYHHDVLEIDDRHRPTHDDASDMFDEWNLGRFEPTGDVVPMPPWWERFHVYPKCTVGGPRPPRDLALLLSKGAVLRDSEWQIPT